MSQSQQRYQRQMLLDGFGPEAQERLSDSTALIVGCGALGSVIADLLGRAGVGHLVLVDRDFVELSNLQRQVLYDEQDAAQNTPKALAAKRKLGRINSQIHVSAIVDDLNHHNIESILLTPNGVEKPCDVIIDGTDNFQTRLLLNDAAVRWARPYVYGGAVGTTGTCMTILPPTPAGDAPWEKENDPGDGNAAEAGGSGGMGSATPCLRCLCHQAPAPGSEPTCDTAGVLGSIAALVASFQATEAIKILIGQWKRIRRQLLHVDVWQNTMRTIDVSASSATDAQAGESDNSCPCCQQRKFEYLNGDLAVGTTTLCGRNAVQVRPGQINGQIDFQQICQRLIPFGQAVVNPHTLRASINDGGHQYQLTLFQNGRAIIKGTNDPVAARSFYAKYIGA
jgi:molybdopterin/thiamine biosynthesis adenylyltransferase